MMNRREFNKLETIKEIQAVFLRLCAKRGIGPITIAELCTECGIAKSTFYLYFDDKYAVLESIEQEHLKALWNINVELADCAIEDVASGVPLAEARRTVQYLKTNADAFKTLLGPHGDTRFSYKWKKDIERSFLGRFRAEKGNSHSAGIACTIFSSSLVGLYAYYLFEMPQMSERELSIILGNLLKYSLFDFQSFTKAPEAAE